VRLLSEQAGDEAEVKHHGSPLVAMRTILVADPVRRLDNILDVAVAAKAVMVLVLVPGLTISIPLAVFCSTRMIRQMERFSIGVTLGTALITGVGGETVASDSAIASLRPCSAARRRCTRPSRRWVRPWSLSWGGYGTTTKLPLNLMYSV